MIDILVSIAVIALLIGIMLPTMAQVREMSRRVICASNVRQMGFGLLMYADDNKDYLAPTLHVRSKLSQDQSSLSARGDTMTIRVDMQTDGLWGDSWDGLGRLYLGEYLLAPRIFYCPSHKGEHPFRNYEDEWARGTGEIVSNYQYRGEAPGKQTRLTRIIPPKVALLTDGMRTIEDFNHAPGMNVLFADLSVEYLWDNDGAVTSLLPHMAKMGSPGGGSSGSSGHIADAWNGIDKLVN